MTASVSELPCPFWMASGFTHHTAAATLPVFNMGPPPAQMRGTHYCHAFTSRSPICPWIRWAQFTWSCSQEGTALSMGQSSFHQRQRGHLQLSEKMPNRQRDTLLSDEIVEYHSTMLCLQPISCSACLSTA